MNFIFVILQSLFIFHRNLLLIIPFSYFIEPNNNYLLITKTGIQQICQIQYVPGSCIMDYNIDDTAVLRNFHIHMPFLPYYNYRTIHYLYPINKDHELNGKIFRLKNAIVLICIGGTAFHPPALTL